MRELAKGAVVWILEMKARYVLWRFEPKIIVVTGSVGKTSTKDAIFAAISSQYSSRKSEKSMNSEFGVPLTILGLKSGWSNPLHWIFNIVYGAFKALLTFSYPKYLVLEVGADKPGDIRKLMSWLVPDVVVATRFPEIPVHVEFYNNPDELIAEESFPLKKLRGDGIFVYNDDDETAVSLKDEFRGKSVCFGTTPRADYFARGDEIIYEKKDGIDIPKGIKFEVASKDNIYKFEIEGVVGVTHVYPIVAAVATAVSLGVKGDKLTDVFKKYKPTIGRMNIIEGIKNSVIIDDTYNSSPVAAESALRTLQRLKAGRRIAVLGAMKELGKYSEDEHKKIGKTAAEVCNILVTVGDEARLIAEGALNNAMFEKNIYQFEDSKKAGKFLETILKPGDIVLIKGSQSIRMERTTQEIMLHPELREKLLVRQEAEWMKR